MEHDELDWWWREEVLGKRSWSEDGDHRVGGERNENEVRDNRNKKKEERGKGKKERRTKKSLKREEENKEGTAQRLHCGGGRT